MAIRLLVVVRSATENRDGSFGFQTVRTIAEPGVEVAGVAVVVGTEAVEVAVPWMGSVAVVGSWSRRMVSATVAADTGSTAVPWIPVPVLAPSSSPGTRCATLLEPLSFLESWSDTTRLVVVVMAVS